MTCPQTEYRNPIRSLIRIQQIYLRAGEETEVVFRLNDSDFYSVNDVGDTVYLSGSYTLYLTDGQSAEDVSGFLRQALMKNMVLRR